LYGSHRSRIRENSDVLPLRSLSSRSRIRENSEPSGNPASHEASYDVCTLKSSCNAALGNDFFDDISVYIRQTEITTAVAIRQSLVIDPQQMQNRCMKVMNADAILNGVDA